MNRKLKKQIIVTYTKLFFQSSSVIIIKNNGLNVQTLESIKTKLNCEKASMLFVKNSLLKIIFNNIFYPCNFLPSLKGSLILIYTNNVLSIIKILTEFNNIYLFEITCILMGYKFLSKHEMTQISVLPSKNKIMSNFINLLYEVYNKLIFILKIPSTSIVFTLKLYHQQKKY